MGKWPRPYDKVAQNLDVFEITGRLWWQHFINRFLPSSNALLLRLQKERWVLGLCSLLPAPPAPLSSAGAAGYASRASLGGVCSTKACFLLSFLPQICSQADCNLPPFLSKPWLTGRGTQPRSCQLCTCLLDVLAFTYVQCHCISFLQMHSHTNAHAHTHTHSSLLYVLGSQKC